MNENPPAVTVWSRALAVVGIPGAISFFLVYMGANEIPRMNKAIEASVRETERTQQLLREHIVQNDELLRLMRWVCAGVAKDDHDRRQCFEK